MKTAFSIVASATLFASVAAADVAPETIPGATTITVETAADLFSDGVTFVDVRKPADVSETGRIKGAVHLDSKTDLNKNALAQHVAETDPVVFYCNGHSCLRSANASKLAVSWGYTSVNYFRGGFPAWYAAGLPTE